MRVQHHLMRADGLQHGSLLEMRVILHLVDGKLVDIAGSLMEESGWEVRDTGDAGQSFFSQPGDLLEGLLEVISRAGSVDEQRVDVIELELAKTVEGRRPEIRCDGRLRVQHLRRDPDFISGHRSPLQHLPDLLLIPVALPRVDQPVALCKGRSHQRDAIVALSVQRPEAEPGHRVPNDVEHAHDVRASSLEDSRIGLARKCSASRSLWTHRPCHCCRSGATSGPVYSAHARATVTSEPLRSYERPLDSALRTFPARRRHPPVGRPLHASLLNAQIDLCRD